MHDTDPSATHTPTRYALHPSATMPAMRILHLCSSINPVSGGPAVVLSSLTPIQAANGHQVSVVTADNPERVRDVVERLKEQGVTVFPGGPTKPPLYRSTAAITEIKRQLTQGVDIVHGHGLWQWTVHFGASAARKAGTPTILRPCGMLDPWCLNESKWKKRAFLALKARKDLNRAKAIHFTTLTEQQLVKPLGLKPPGYVIPNGIDWAEFAELPAYGRFRNAHDIGDRPLVVYLSRLHHKKGLDLLLPAFAAHCPKDAVLALVGPATSPAYLQSLKDDAKRLNIADRVLYPGMLRGQARIEALVDADVFTLPSYQENFGVVVVEAAACGTAVHISDQVNIHGDLTEAGAGIVTPTEEQAIGKALARLLEDRDHANQLGALGRAWARDRFAWPNIAGKIDEMYNDATA